MLHYLADSLNIAVTLYLVMSVYTLTRPPSIANRLLFLCMFICSIWAFSYYQELNAESATAKLAWMRGRYLFLPPLSVLWLMTSAELAGIRTRIRGWTWLALFIIPAVTIPISFTMQHHTLFRHGFYLATDSSIQPLRFINGPWCLVYEYYGFAIQFVSLYMLGQACRNAQAPLRSPVRLLFVSSLLPIIGNVLFNINPFLFEGMNPAPLLLFPAASSMALAIFRKQLLNIAPVARTLLFDRISEGIIVTDPFGHLIDINKAAQSMLEDLAKARGTDAAGPLTRQELLAPRAGDTHEFQFGEPDTPRWYKRTRLPLIVEGKQRGWMYLFQDTTAQQELHQRELSQVRHEEEEKRRRQWTMLLCDLHDGIGAVSANIGLLAALGRNANTDEAKNTLFGQIADLAREANIEIRSMMNALESRSMTWLGLMAEIRQYAALVLEPRGIAFHLTVAGTPGADPDITDATSIFRIVKEAIANSAKHASPESVEVEFRFGSGFLELFISDDGRWKTEASEGRGLRHMRQRVQSLGGVFQLQTQPSTRLFCLLPTRRVKAATET